ncbi:uncharacterized protein L201_000598 [Kwoniella dendrophila CBS 6074]|uniref:Uncharacterized protein n=1 Tax=Kwoniella dendrophila CBS 6074 TaxID=1295534 RepID=A0AAX4JJZ3_9TREE
MFTIKLLSLLLLAITARALVVIPTTSSSALGPEETMGLTNAERFAKGLNPATPKSLDRSVPSKVRKQLSKSLTKRGPACPSASPIAFPSEPPSPSTILSNEQLEDFTFTVNLPFPVQIFGSTSNTIYVNNNGFISLSNPDNYFPGRMYNTGENVALPAHGKTADSPLLYALFAYWDDLYIYYDITYMSVGYDNKSVTLKFLERANAGDTRVSFTVYYTTDSPGRWYIYYDGDHYADGDSATIGAQGGAELDGILTNAERLARGLKPATPRALEPKEINSATRTLKRGPACPSASPIVFPGELPIPTTLVAFEDDNAFQIELPFPVQIFQSSDHNVWVSTNGASQHLL